MTNKHKKKYNNKVKYKDNIRDEHRHEIVSADNPEIMGVQMSLRGLMNKFN